MNERTVIQGFYNKGNQETQNETAVKEKQVIENQEEVNVTWIFWLLGGISLAALAMSIISLILACN